MKPAFREYLQRATLLLVWIRRRSVKIAVSVALTLVVGVALTLGFVAYSVRFGDDANLRKEVILAKLAQETPIFYLDGKTQLGSFFGDAHRQYVSLDQIPDELIKAVVSSEDKNFYSHRGIDFGATAKAFLEGLGQRNFHRAGSSITQQTVKILFNDWEHSFRRKFSEATSALKMERLYSKRQILEFYLNQFHVTGNGNGIAVAARYYFNKDVRDLNLTEAAFIAGSVKNPTKFNPFTKTSQQGRLNAEKAAFDRKNYVLRRMRQDGTITEEVFQQALPLSVPFNHGEFQSGEVSLIELVRRQLENPEILAALGIKDSEDLNHAGIKVYTTIDSQLQADAQLAVRRNLSRLDTIIRGYKTEAKPKFKRYSELVPNEFYYGLVTAINRDAKTPSIEVSFGMATGTVATDSLQRLGSTLSVATGQSGAFHVKNILKGLRPGDVLFTQVLSYDPKSHWADLDLQKRPEINGGLIAVDGGEIRAVVSGFDTSGYNRSVFGTRQPGSVFKSIVFYAALQLGWSILDQLQNEPQIFPYQNRFYYPRGAHESPYDDETMLYAGAESENIATVYLAAHLLDRLTFEDFKKILGLLDLLPSAGEAPADFQFRVAKRLGVSLDKDGVKEYQLANAVADISPDLIFSGKQSLLKSLRDMWWGRGYDLELSRLTKHSAKAKQQGEAAQRTKLVLNNYQRMRELEASLATDWSRIKLAVELRGAVAAFQNPEILSLIKRFHIAPAQGEDPTGPGLAYWGTLPPAAESLLIDRATTPLTAPDAEMIWGSTVDKASSQEDVKLDGYLPVAILQQLTAKLEARYAVAMADHDPYGLYQFYQHHDFRLATGLNYLIALSQAMGVQSKLSPVLSFPLGTNAVSLADIAKIYQTFIEGKIYRFFDSGPPNQLNLIRRIESSNGTVLYEAKRQETQLVDPRLSGQIQEILRKVVTNGTATVLMQDLTVSAPELLAANKEGAVGAPKLQLANPQIRVPVFGKTGTTNDFTNGTFAGLLPYPTEAAAPLTVVHSYVIAAYAGFDGNQPMRKGQFRGFGGLVALPAWSEFARNVIKHKEFGKFVDYLDLTTIASHEWPLRTDDSLPKFKIDLVKGTVLSDQDIVTPEMQGPPAPLAAEQASKMEIAAQHHDVFVRLPGKAEGSVYSPDRIVNLFTPPRSEATDDAFDAEGLESESNPSAALDSEAASAAQGDW